MCIALSTQCFPSICGKNFPGDLGRIITSLLHYFWSLYPSEVLHECTYTCMYQCTIELLLHNDKHTTNIITSCKNWLGGVDISEFKWYSLHCLRPLITLVMVTTAVFRITARLTAYKTKDRIISWCTQWTICTYK